MNTFGNKFRVSIFGESHGPHIGVTLDGVLPGIPLTEADFLQDLSRRKAGALGTTPRTETDLPEIVTGVYEGHTTGAPLTILFKNENTRSEDYESFRKHPRPGHADFTANLKYGGFNDPRGGGHFSGRLTLGVVAAGVVAKKMLYFAQFHAQLVAVGGLTDPQAWKGALEAAQADGDSLGGVVECTVENLPIGLGEPFWNSVESNSVTASRPPPCSAPSTTTPSRSTSAITTNPVTSAATAKETVILSAAKNLRARWRLQILRRLRLLRMTIVMRNVIATMRKAASIIAAAVTNARCRLSPTTPAA